MRLSRAMPKREATSTKKRMGNVSQSRRNTFSSMGPDYGINHAPGSVKDAFYVLHHIKGFVRDAEKTRWPSSLQEWTKLSGEITDADLREYFHHIQMQLWQIILEDVMKKGRVLTQLQRYDVL